MKKLKQNETLKKKKMEDQRSRVTLPMAHSLEATEPGFRLSSGWNKYQGLDSW